MSQSEESYETLRFWLPNLTIDHLYEAWQKNRAQFRLLLGASFVVFNEVPILVVRPGCLTPFR
jgi:hypothetical protein